MKFKTLTVCALLAGAAMTASAGHPSAQLESTRVIRIDAAALDINNTIRRDQTRFTTTENTEIVGEQGADGLISWRGSDRERLGGQDAAQRILVRAFDAVFSIDPFMPLPVGNETAARILFNGASLETDRTLFNRIRIDRTEELLHILEGARHRWLRDNGFYGVTTVRNPNAGAMSESEDQAGDPEPAGWFRRPADVPRGRSIEEVRGSETRTESIAAGLLDTDEPIRISLPFGTDEEVVARVEARNERGSENEETELASNE